MSRQGKGTCIGAQGLTHDGQVMPPSPRLRLAVIVIILGTVSACADRTETGEYPALQPIDALLAQADAAFPADASAP